MTHVQTRLQCVYVVLSMVVSRKKGDWYEDVEAVIALKSWMLDGVTVLV